jgi:hypothetical protein
MQSVVSVVLPMHHFYIQRECTDDQKSFDNAPFEDYADILEGAKLTEMPEICMQMCSHLYMYSESWDKYFLWCHHLRLFEYEISELIN